MSNEIELALNRLNKQMSNEIEFITIKGNGGYYLKYKLKNLDGINDLIYSNSKKDLIKRIDDIYSGIALSNSIEFK